MDTIPFNVVKLPLYQCYKKVRAAKVIKEMAIIPLTMYVKRVILLHYIDFAFSVNPCQGGIGHE